MIDERQQDIQTKVIGRLHLLIHVASGTRNRIHPLGAGSALRREENTNTNLSQELDETLEHIIAIGITIIVDI